MIEVFKKILESISDQAFIIGPDFKILYSNYNEIKSNQKKSCYEAIFNQKKPCSYCLFFETPGSPVAGPECLEKSTHLVNHPLFHLKQQTFTLFQKKIEINSSVYFLEIISGMKSIDADLQNSDHLTTLGAHVQTIGHELSNPITGLNLTHRKISEIFRKKTEVTASELKPFLDLLGSDLKRASEIVSDIRSYSQVNRPMKIVDLRNTISNAIENVRRIHPNRKVSIKLEWGLPEKINFHGNSGKLEQCFLNILKNSYDMFEIRGKIKNPEINIVTNSAENGKIIALHIIDNAGGISNDALRNAFKPYFTTKERYRGQGLGLYITGQIIKEHGGSISMNSSGFTTTVTILLKIPE